MAALTRVDERGGPDLALLRSLVGSEVVVQAAWGRLRGTLLSCTARSAWLVSGDVDHLVALGGAVEVHRA